MTCLSISHTIWCLRSVFAAGWSLCRLDQDRRCGGRWKFSAGYHAADVHSGFRWSDGKL